MKKKLTIAIGVGISIIIGVGRVNSLSLSKIINGITKVGDLTGLGAQTLERYGVDTSDLKKLNKIIGDAETVVKDANNYYVQFSSFYSAIVNQDVEGSLVKAQNLAGILGIPDPDALKDAPEKTISDYTYAGANQKYLDLFLVEGIAKSTLSKEGQQRLMEQQQQSLIISGAIAKNAATIGDKNITQDVMKLIAQNQSHLGEIATTQSNQLMNLQVNTAATNYSLANINKFLDIIFDAEDNANNIFPFNAN